MLLCSVGSVAAEQTLTGSARAASGGVLIVRGARIKLFGIAAPERDEQCDGVAGAWPCGRQSKAALVAAVAGEQVDCAIRHKVDHGYWQATCVAGGADLAVVQLNTGVGQDSAR